MPDEQILANGDQEIDELETCAEAMEGVTGEEEEEIEGAVGGVAIEDMADGCMQQGTSKLWFNILSIITKIHH